MKFRLPKTRRYRIYLYIASVLMILLAIDLIWVRIGRHIRIAHDTTRITAPLRPDGLPDYIQAIEDRERAGVTRDNNAAPLLLRVFGPVLMPDDPSRTAAYAALAIDPLPAAGAYFISSSDFLKRSGKNANDPARVDISSRITASPWTATEYPDMAAWLEANAAPLDLLRQARSRSHLFLPRAHNRMNAPNEILISMLIPNLGRPRDAANALVARALLRGGAADFGSARQDFAAAFHLGTLIGTQPNIIEHMVGIAIEQNTLRAMRALAAAETLTAAQARQLLADLDALPPRTPMADALDCERFAVLDVIVLGVRIGPARAVQLVAPEGRLSGAPGQIVLTWAGDLLLPIRPGNFNRALRDVNGYFDQMVAAASATSFADSQRQTQALDEQIGQRMNAIRTSPFPDTAQLLTALVMPSFGRAGTYDFMLRTEFNLTRVTLALAAYHADHHEYPEALQALAPTYLNEIPLDPFLDAPLHYTRTARGFTAYSLGPNMKDDEAQSRDKHDDAHPHADDIVTRAGE